LTSPEPTATPSTRSRADGVERGGERAGGDGAGETRRTGLAFGVGAYALWGVFPLYFPLLKPADPLEILAHRVVWSMVLSVLLLLLRPVRRGFGAVVRDRRRLLRLCLAGVVLGVNWFTFIWGVNHGEVLQTSLGYYINPLVTVLLAVLVLRERLRRLQWVALGFGFAAVLWLTVDYGRLPWLALVLAFSFGAYGLFKKQVSAPAVHTLVVETAVLTPLALAWLAGLTLAGQSTFAADGVGHAGLLASTGLVTAVPLLLFAGAATRLPLRVVGMLQYLTPTMQLAIGVFVVREPLPPGRLVGFCVVWLALALLSVDGLRARRASLRALLPTDRPVASRCG